MQINRKEWKEQYTTWMHIALGEKEDFNVLHFL
jgi:hypothetical protein